MNEDGTLKEDALKEYLEQVNRIWQTQKDAIEDKEKLTRWVMTGRIQIVPDIQILQDR